MERSWKTLFLLTFFCTFGLMTSVRAQIIPDNSLGAETSTVGQPNQPINGIPINQIDQINGGARRGGNLFHSFGEFNVNAGRAAYFTNPAGVENILTRVTGVNRSNILGTLGVLGNANLFLINPNGIFFGPNSSLDVRGSFLGSSANSLLFDNGFEFSATNAIAPPLLTVNIPVGLRFRDNPGSIQVQRNGQGLRGTTDLIDTTDALRVQPNQTLALVGGDISLEGATLKTAGGRIELGSVAGEGLVSLTPTNKGFSLGYGGVQNFGNIQLAQQTAVDASGEGGGNIQVIGRRITLNDGSEIEASTLGSQPGGSLVVNAQELVELSGTSSDGQFSSGLFTLVYPGATGSGGNLEIKTGTLSLTNGSTLDSSTFGQGNAGNLTINSGNLTLQQKARISSQTDGTGDGGDITINTGKLISQDGSVITSSTSNTGKAGDLTVHASELVELSGDTPITPSGSGSPGGLLAQAENTSSGNARGGTLTVETPRLSISNGSKVQAATFGNADAGNLIIRAPDIDIFDTPDSNNFFSTGIFVGVQTDPRNTEPSRGAGGSLTIETERLRIRNGGNVDVSTYGIGNAGNLFIKATELVEVIGTGEAGTYIGANVYQGARGNGGDLTIDTKKLVVRNAQVSASVFGKGNAGNLTVNATDSVELSGKVFSTGESGQIIRNPAGLFAQVNIQGEGKGGSLTIDTPRLSVGDGARVQVATFGQGDAGNLLIRASDIDVYETANANFFPGGIFAGFQADEDEQRVPPRGGNGGILRIETDRLRVRDGGRVSTTTQGQGNAGLLQIRAKDSVEVFGLSPNNRYISEISAGATPESTGTGGSLIINTGKLIVRDRGTVTVRSENTQPAGNLEITARTINLENQGSLTATTNSGDGGDITLNVRDYLFLRGNSEISTSARGNGNGGNIRINTPFIVAFPRNNDIIANAVSGNGGRVRTNATLFGIIPRTRADLERLGVPGLNPRNLPTSDITAFSEQNSNFGDNLQLTSPDVDPSRGLVELPETVSDRTQQIAQSPCRQGFGNEFVITGRGGLPTTPNETLSSNNVRVDLLQPVATSGNSPSATITKPATTFTATRVPAQGWIFNQKGQVVLTAYDPTNTGSQRPFSTAAACPAR